MTKEDVAVRERPPAKRRQLEQSLDFELAVWLASGNLTPSDRRRVEEEKARRRALRPSYPAGVLVGPEGITPEQLQAVHIALLGSRPTEINSTWVSSKLHSRFRELGVPVNQHAGLREVVIASRVVIAAPRTPEPNGGLVWEFVRYARHRSIPAIVILPSGEEME